MKTTGNTRLRVGIFVLVSLAIGTSRPSKSQVACVGRMLMIEYELFQQLSRKQLTLGHGSFSDAIDGHAKPIAGLHVRVNHPCQNCRHVIGIEMGKLTPCQAGRSLAFPFIADSMNCLNGLLDHGRGWVRFRGQSAGDSGSA